MEQNRQKMLPLKYLIITECKRPIIYTYTWGEKETMMYLKSFWHMLNRSQLLVLLIFHFFFVIWTFWWLALKQ